jgi:hypothetical protein
VNALVRPVVILLTLPITIVTFGVFLLVVNAGMFGLVAWLLDGFAVSGFFAALFGWLIVSFVSWLASWYIGPRGRYRSSSSRHVVIERRYWECSASETDSRGRGFAGASAALADVMEKSSERHTATLTEGEAAVYFMRPATLGFAVNFWAFVDDTVVGVTKGNTYTFAAVPAGEHVIWSRSGNVSALKVTLEAGKSYYFEQKVRMGGVKARVSLEPMDEAAALEALAKDDYTTLTEEGKTQGAEYLAEDYAEALEIAAQPSP